MLLFQVAYPSGAKVSLGNKLGCEQVKDVPSVNWPADPNKFYTLCMTGNMRFYNLK